MGFGPGTLDVAGIVGLAVAVQDAVSHRAERAALLAGLRDDLIAAVMARIPTAVLSGDPGSVAGGRRHRPGCPATRTCGSPAARAIRC